MTNVHTFKNINYYHNHCIIFLMVTLVTKVTITCMVAVVLSFNKVCLVTEFTIFSVVNTGKLMLPAFFTDATVT